MVNLTSFYQKCVYFCVIIFIFILAFNFMYSFGVFGNVQVGPQISGDPGNYTQSVFGMNVSNTDLWGYAFGTAIVGAIPIAIATGSTIAVAVYLFSVTFWTGFLQMWSVFSTLFLGSTMTMFLAIGFAVVIIIFIAAIVGLLGGGG